jgi:Tat protein secretion system quality control protein TatD with DNase activity
MLITDTHTHLYSDEFEQDRSEMIQKLLMPVCPDFLFQQLIRLLHKVCTN